MLAYHFLREDMTAGSGDEPPWTVGQKRTYRGKPVLCERGYHSSPLWLDALGYAPGTMACLVEVSTPVERDNTKQVSKSRKLLAASNVARELRLFACDCAQRALQRERDQGREPDERSWDAVEVSYRFANGKATQVELGAAWDAARSAADAAWNAADAAWDAARSAAGSAADAASSAAWHAASSAARSAADAAWNAADAAWDAASSAAGSATWHAAEAAWNAARSAADAASSAARSAEIAWQRQRLAAYLDPLFADMLVKEAHNGTPG